VIIAAGSAKVDRCAFLVTGNHRPKGSRALFSNGGVLEVNRSWFKGFDDAIDIIAMNRTPTRIRHTMIVLGSRRIGDQAQPPSWYGWGVRLQLMTRGGSPKKNASPHLIMDHCTVEGAGLIDLTSTLAPSICEIEVTGCAVRVDALLACRRDLPTSVDVRWHGMGNQYDILGQVWIVLSAKEGTPAFSTAVTDLQGWLRFAPDDRNPRPDKLKFLADAKPPAELTQPQDFKVLASSTLGSQPGADPKLVGPWSNP
jgi:hypothetical protein